MVHIINGEIVADDDPRVRARFQQQSQPSSTSSFGAGAQRRGVSGFGNLSGASTSSSPPPPAAAAAAPASPLQGLARQLGLEGTFIIPSFFGFPARPVQKIHLALAALMTLLFGWRALVFLAFAFFLTSQQPAQQRQQ